MKIKNQEADALETNITVHDFGKAMSQLNLDGVPEHNRSKTIMDHLMKVMADTIKDKEQAQIIHISRLMRNKK